MGSFSIWHWLIGMAIVVLVVGSKKLKNIGSGLGGAVKGFKDGIKDGNESAAAQPTSTTTAQQQVGQTPVADKTTIDVEAKNKG